MLGNSLISFAIKMTTRFKITDPTSGMRLYGREVIKDFALDMNYGPEPDTISLFLKKGLKVKEIQVHMEERMAGESYLSLSKSIFYMMRMLISILIIQPARR